MAEDADARSQRRGVGGAGTAVAHRAGGGTQQRGQDAEQRGLPGAVGAQHADDLAAARRERHPVERPAAAEGARHVVDGHRRRSRSGVTRRRPRRLPAGPSSADPARRRPAPVPKQALAARRRSARRGQRAVAAPGVDLVELLQQCFAPVRQRAARACRRSRGRSPASTPSSSNAAGQPQRHVARRARCGTAGWPASRVSGCAGRQRRAACRARTRCRRRS